MIAFVAALSLAQALVLDRAPLPADSITAAEMVRRPPGLSTAAFLDQLVGEAGASDWERLDQTVPFRDVEVRLVGLRGAGSAGLMLILLAGEEASGNVCRIRRVREGAPGPESEQAIHYCLRSVTEGR